MTFAEILQSEKETPDAELLLAFTAGLDRAQLFVRAGDPVSTEIETRFRELATRRRSSEPLAYLTGEKEFFGRKFQVGPAVLIPRPETELLVETILAFAAGLDSPRILDVGTGSGCIAVSLALELQSARVAACDISPAALEIARQNAARLGSAVEFRESDLLAAIEAEPEIIAANLPYIPESDPALEPAVQAFEPNLALFAGPDGLDLYRRLFDEIRAKSWRPRLVACEIGAGQAAAFRELVSARFPESQLEFRRDLAGIERVALLHFTR